MVGAVASTAVAFAAADWAALDTMSGSEVGPVAGCAAEAERHDMINGL
jgi:hypothetical protein